MNETRIGVALTHWNRFPLLQECIRDVLDDPRIAEFAISDDCSNGDHWEQIRELTISTHLRSDCRAVIKAWRNPRNMDCYRNKKLAVDGSTQEWVILFDSDNILTKKYIDSLYSIDKPWNPRVAYCPEFAEPHFDFRHLAGKLFDRSNVAQFMMDDKFLTMLNAMNYFVNREQFIRVWDGSVDPHTADSIYQNYRWLDAGNSIYVVPGLRYFHRVHPESHYKQNVHKTGSFYSDVIRKLKSLKCELSKQS